MTGLLLGLVLGVGLFLVWWSCWVPAAGSVVRHRRSGPLHRLADDIVQAGFSGLSLRTLGAACVIALSRPQRGLVALVRGATRPASVRKFTSAHPLAQCGMRHSAQIDA